MSTNSKGFDTTRITTAHIPAIKEAGFSFVARYSSHSEWKNMTHAEVQALSKAGIFCVNVWESAGDHASFFTHAQGVADGASAVAFARNIGQPHSAPIYFAVDADLPGPGGVHAYFEGVREAFQTHGEIGKDVYHVGVYGSGSVCEHLTQVGYVSHTWMAYADGWSGNKTYHDWNLKQSHGSTLAGMSIDLDESAVKGGGGFLVEV